MPQGIFTIISAFVHRDDEVIIFKPAYDCYQPAIEVNGGHAIPIQLSAPNYEINWKQCIWLPNNGQIKTYNYKIRF